MSSSIFPLAFIVLAIMEDSEHEANVGMNSLVFSFFIILTDFAISLATSKLRTRMHEAQIAQTIDRLAIIVRVQPCPP